VLRVEALGTLGRTKEAAALARRLVNQGVSPAQRQALERWLDSSK
jgi:ferric-dicitrate binding protein FerR (iron transport regulator)